MNSKSPIRRYSYPLREGHKAAYLCAESTEYRYIKELSTPKNWFMQHIDSIMQVYGPELSIKKEQLFLGKFAMSSCLLFVGLIQDRLVTGILNVRDYALFISHHHPNGQVSPQDNRSKYFFLTYFYYGKVHFEVSSPRKPGQLWGNFTMESSIEFDGHSHQFQGNPIVAGTSKVSEVNATDIWNTVLLAHLRFKS